MPIKKHLLLFFIFFLSLAIFSQVTVKAMFYNIVKFTQSSAADKQAGHIYIYNDVRPDLYMVAEAGINSPDHILGLLNNVNNIYARTQMFSNVNASTDTNHQLAFYNRFMFDLVAEEAIGTAYLTTGLRNIDHFTFKFKQPDINNNIVYLDVFVAHLKSSDGTTDRKSREAQVDTFNAALSALDPSHYVIFAGDFNLYTSNEKAYIKATTTTTTAIKMKDPMGPGVLCVPFPETDPPGGDVSWSANPEIFYYWHDNPDFQYLHTQNPRVTGGGMDDRFDFMLTSENILNQNSSLSLIPNSYKPFGNNGNCLNKDITDTTCDGFYSPTLRNHLKNASDHIPVVMELNFKSISLSDNNYAYTSLSFKSSNVSTTDIALSVAESCFNSDLMVFNQWGQLVKTIHLDDNSVINNQLLLDISEMSTGVYIINLKDQALTKPLRFIKI